MPGGVPSSAPSRSTTPNGRSVEAWLAFTAFGAGIGAALDLAFASFAAPLTTSSVVGAVHSWAATTGLLALASAPFAVGLFALDRPRVRALLPAPSALASSSVVGVAAALVLSTIDDAVEPAMEEFTHEPEIARWAIRAIAVAGLALAHTVMESTFRRAFATFSPGARSRLATIPLALAGVVLIYIAHRAFGPLFAVRLASACLVSATVLLVVSLRAILEPPRSRAARSTVAVVAALGLAAVAVPQGREHARYVLFTHSAAAGAAEVLRDLVDGDGDGAATTWLGGRDCRDGDPSVGPVLRERPGNQIDEDCRGGDAPPPAALGAPSLPESCRRPAKPWSVLVIIVDALRHDAVAPEVMPNVSALANDSWTFERAYSPTGMTVTSVSSMLTARPLADVGAANPLVDGTLEAPFTVAERFAARGYRTALFSDYILSPLHSRGFAAINPEWRDYPSATVKQTLTSATTSRSILEAMSAATEPVFVWTHISDTHARYKLRADKNGVVGSERDAYLRGAAYVDRQLGRLLGQLQANKKLDDTIVVLSADHAEGLMDHGHQGHGPSVYEEDVHVPLIVRVPGCAPERFASPVSNRGVGPTLAALTGVDVPGRGLFDQGDDPVVVEGPSGLNTHFKRAIIGPRYKLIVDVPNGGAVLFDLQSDPGETTVIDDPAARADLEAGYQRWLDTPGAR